MGRSARRAMASRLRKRRSRFYSSGADVLYPDQILRAGAAQAARGDQPNELARIAKNLAGPEGDRLIESTRPREGRRTGQGGPTGRGAPPAPRGAALSAGDIGRGILDSASDQLPGAGGGAALGAVTDNPLVQDLAGRALRAAPGLGDRLSPAADAFRGITDRIPAEAVESASAVTPGADIIVQPAIARAEAMKERQHEELQRGLSEIESLELERRAAGATPEYDLDAITELRDKGVEGINTRDILGAATSFLRGYDYIDAMTRHVSGDRFSAKDLPFHDQIMSTPILRSAVDALSPYTIAAAAVGAPGAGIALRGAAAKIAAQQAAGAGLRVAARNSSTRGAELLLRGMANVAETGLQNPSFQSRLAREFVADITFQEIGYSADAAGLHPLVGIGAGFVGGGGAFYGPELGAGGMRLLRGRVGRMGIEYETGRPYETLESMLVPIAGGSTAPLDADDIAEAGRALDRLGGGGWELVPPEAPREAFHGAEWFAPSGHATSGSPEELLRDAYGIGGGRTLRTGRPDAPLDELVEGPVARQATELARENVDPWTLSRTADRTGSRDTARLREAIEESGEIDPVVVNERGVVIDGNHRVTVAREMGISSIPVVRIAENRPTGGHDSLVVRGEPPGPGDSAAEATMLRQGWVRSTGSEVRVWDLDRQLSDDLASMAVDDIFAQNPAATVRIYEQLGGSRWEFDAAEWKRSQQRAGVLAVNSRPDATPEQHPVDVAHLSDRGTDVPRETPEPYAAGPSPDDIDEVGDANFNSWVRGPDEQVDPRTLQGVEIENLYDPDSLGQLREQITANRRFDRIIVDDQDNVLEGQHRLRAALELGLPSIPVARIIDLENQFPIAAMSAAARPHVSHSDQASEVARQAAEHIQEGGNAKAALAELDPSDPFIEARRAAYAVAEEQGGAGRGDELRDVAHPVDIVRLSDEAPAVNVQQAGFDAQGRPVTDDLGLTEEQFNARAAIEQGEMFSESAVPRETPASELSGQTALTESSALPLSQIEVDPDRFQFRDAGVDERNVRRIAENFDERNFDPLLVWRDPADGRYFLLSGHHRLEAVRQLGHSSVPVRVIAGSEADAVGLASIANTRDAPLGFIDRLNTFRYWEGQGESAADIASRTGRREHEVRATLAIGRLGIEVARSVNSDERWIPAAFRYANFVNSAPEEARETFAEQIALAFLNVKRDFGERGMIPSVAAVDADLAVRRTLFENQPALFGLAQEGLLPDEMLNMWGVSNEHLRLRDELTRKTRELVREQKRITRRAEASGVAEDQAVLRMTRDIEADISMLTSRAAHAEAEVALRMGVAESAIRAGVPISTALDGEASDIIAEPGWTPRPDERRIEELSAGEQAAVATMLPAAAAQAPHPSAVVQLNERPPTRPLPLPSSDLPYPQIPYSDRLLGPAIPFLDLPAETAPRVPRGQPTQRRGPAEAAQQDELLPAAPTEQTVEQVAQFAPHVLTQDQLADLAAQQQARQAAAAAPASLSGITPPRVMRELRELLTQLGAPPGTPPFGNPYRLIDDSDLTEAWRLGRRELGLPQRGSLLGIRTDPERVKIGEPLRTLDARTKQARSINRLLVELGENLLPDGVGVRDPISGRLVIDPALHPDIRRFHNALDRQQEVREGLLRVPKGYEDAYAFALRMRDWEEDYTLAFKEARGESMGEVEDYWARIYTREYLDDTAGALPAAGSTVATGTTGAGRLLSASFRRPRSGMSVEQALGHVFTDDDGRRYILDLHSWNPFEQAARRSESGWDYRQQRATIDALLEFGEAKPKGNVAPNGMRTPNIGPLWQGHIVDDAIARKLELSFADAITGHVGNIEVWRAAHSSFLGAKRAILSFSLFQHIDIASRMLGFGLGGGGLENLSRGELDLGAMPQAVRTITRTFRAQVDPAARRNTQIMINSAVPQNPRGDISFGDVFGSGGAHIGDPSLRTSSAVRSAERRWTAGAIETIEAADEGAISSALRVSKEQTLGRAGRIKQHVEDGLFDQLYPIMAMQLLRSQIMPAVDNHRVYSNWNPQRRAAVMAGMVNRQMGSVGDWDSVINDRLIRDAADLITFSRGETESQFAMFFGAFSGEDAAFWRKNMTGFVLFTLVAANAIHFAFNGELLPYERNIPLDYEPGSGVLGVNYRGGYGGFAQPTVPIAAASGLPVTVDLVGQMDTALRVLDGPQAFSRARLGAVPGQIFDQFTGADFFGNPLDSPGERGAHLATAFTPISAQAGIQIARTQGFNPGGVIPEGEASLGARGLAVQALGVNLSSPSALDILDSEALRLFGQTYNDLEPGQKNELQDNLSEAASAELERKTESGAQRGSESAQRRLDQTEIRAAERAQINRQLGLLETSAISPKQFREAYTRIKRDAAHERAGNNRAYADFFADRAEPEDPNELALFRYYRIYDDLRALGTPDDYDEITRRQEALYETLSLEQRSYIERNTGTDPDDPSLSERERHLIITRDGLRNSGYWDLTPISWGVLQKAVAGSGASDPIYDSLARFDEFYDFKRHWEAQYTQSYQRAGLSEGRALEEAKASFQQMDVVKAFYDARTSLRSNWIIDNPCLADSALQYEYLSGTDKEHAAYLDAYQSGGGCR